MFPHLIHLIFLLGSMKEFGTNKTSDEYNLTVYHTSNIQGRFDDQEKGGLAKISHYLTETRAKNQSSLYLDAGGVFIGTELFFVHGINVTSAVMNYLKPDAVTLGFSEFHLGLDRLKWYLEQIEFPVIVSNIIYDDQTSEFEKLIETKLVLEMGAKQVGILGFIDPDVNKIYKLKELKFEDPVYAIKTHLEALKTIDKVDIVIVLSHVMNHESDTFNLEVIALDGVNAVISGQYLKNPEDENVICYHAQFFKNNTAMPDGCFATNLGFFEINIKDDEVFTEVYEVALSKVDEKYTEMIQPFVDNVTEFNEEIIGTSKVFLDGENCWKQECNFGNLLADSMIYYRSIRYKGLDWSDTPIAIINARSLKQSINTTSHNYKLRKIDILSSISNNEILYLIELEGVYLREILNYGLTMLKSDSIKEEKEMNQKYLSVSGIYAIYDYNHTESILVRCAHCRVPKYSDITSNMIYKIITSQFMALGGDGYTQLAINARTIKPMYASNLALNLIEYIQSRKDIFPEVQERITFIEYTEDSSRFSTIISVVLLLCLLLINFLLYF
ncbi:protein 5NUC-like [Onthophagus taurus]|uniref:protein 5NUC-like n=1 Tax=Onthophagus taurus TaxID=166361 RepID=UPI0039BE8FEE